MRTMLSFLLITMTLYTGIKAEYSMSYYYPFRLGQKAKEVQMVINSKESETILFSNTERPYSEEILTNTEMDIFKDSVEINGQVLNNFSFSVKEDTTELKNPSLQGIMGLGISLDTETNDLFEALHESQLIERKTIFIKTLPKAKVEFLVDKNKKDLVNFTYCGMTDKDDLEEKYHDGWVCEYTHLLLDNKTEKKEELSWNDTFQVHGRAIFDTTSSYIIAPLEYYSVIFSLLELNETICKSVEDLATNETYLNCAFTNTTDFNKMNSFYFMFDGFAYPVHTKDLFKNTTKGYVSMIKFRNETNNIWTFGYPFFSNYEVQFDYDEKKVGFNGENPLNFTAEWNEWLIENQSFLNRVYNDKTIMIVGAILGSIILVTILALIIRAFARRQNPAVHSQLIEEGKGNEGV